MLEAQALWQPGRKRSLETQKDVTLIMPPEIPSDLPWSPNFNVYPLGDVMVGGNP